MKRLFILSFTPRNAVAVFIMINGLFNNNTYFIGIFPFRSTAKYTRISSVILFRVDINYSAAGRLGTWIFTMTKPTIFTVATFIPAHHWEYKLKSSDSTKMRGITFWLHRKRRIMWTTRNAIFV